MQMPPAGEHIRDVRTAHERRVIALAPADLFHRTAKHDHGVGRQQSHLRMEGKLALARPELDLDRAQWEPERHHGAPDPFQYRLSPLDGPGGILRSEARIIELEDMKLDFKAGDVVETGLGQFSECPPAKMAR